MVTEIIAATLIVLLFAAAYFIIRKYENGLFGSSDLMLAAAIPLSFAVLAGLTSLLGIFLPTSFAAIIAYLIILLAGFLSFFDFKKRAQPSWLFQNNGKNKVVDYLIIFIISFTLILLVINSFVILPNNSISIDAGAIVDTPYHLSQIIRIGTVKYLDFQEPNFSGEFIRYPFFINLISGLLLKMNASLFFSFYAPLILLIISAMFLLVYFFRFLNFGNTLTIFSVLGVLFGAGLGYIAYLKSHGAIPLPIRRGIPYPMQNISYPGMIPGFLIVQRAFILGFPLFILALISFLKGLKSDSRAFMVWSAIIVSLLPFSHSHSFFAIIIFSGAVLVYCLIANQNLFIGLVRYFVFPVFILSIFQLGALALMPKYPLPKNFGFRVGWMTQPNEVGGLNLRAPNAFRFFPWLRFIWTNFGFLLILPLAAISFLRRLKTPAFIQYVLWGSLAMWIIPNLFYFQIWDFDTNKFFSYAILLSIASTGLIIQSLNPPNRKFASIIFVAIIILSLPSSLISISNIFKYKSQRRLIMFSPGERQVAAWLAKNTKEDATILSSAAILTPTAIQNPITVLAGRKSTAGFMAWLYTHGIDFDKRITLINQFFGNPAQNKNIFADNKVPADFFIIDPIIAKMFPQMEKQIIDAGLSIIYQDNQFKIVALSGNSNINP